MTSKDFFKEVKLEWCASEQQDKPLLNDMMKFAKLYHKEQLLGIMKEIILKHLNELGKDLEEGYGNKLILLEENDFDNFAEALVKKLTTKFM